MSVQEGSRRLPEAFDLFEIRGTMPRVLFPGVVRPRGLRVAGPPVPPRGRQSDFEPVRCRTLDGSQNHPKRNWPALKRKSYLLRPRGGVVGACPAASLAARLAASLAASSDRSPSPRHPLLHHRSRSMAPQRIRVRGNVQQANPAASPSRSIRRWP
jgi:hypothetical protein